MELGCPLCNGLTDVEVVCPQCGHPMADGGAVEDYYGPYSPYENYDLYTRPPGSGGRVKQDCVHLMVCPECGYDRRVGFARAVLP